jgi:hypothetical protein
MYDSQYKRVYLHCESTERMNDQNIVWSGASPKYWFTIGTAHRYAHRNLL